MRSSRDETYAFLPPLLGGACLTSFSSCHYVRPSTCCPSAQFIFDRSEYREPWTSRIIATTQYSNMKTNRVLHVVSSILTYLFAKTTEEGVRSITYAAVAGPGPGDEKPLHGKLTPTCEVQAVSSFAPGEEGHKVEGRFWVSTNEGIQIGLLRDANINARTWNRLS